MAVHATDRLGPVRTSQLKPHVGTGNARDGAPGRIWNFGDVEITRARSQRKFRNGLAGAGLSRLTGARVAPDAPDRAASARWEGGAASAGPCQPGKLRVQAQAGLVNGFRGRRGEWGHRRYGGLGSAEAQVAAVSASAAGA